MSMDQLTGVEPYRDTSPQVGRRPTTPHHPAGERTEPPVSSPSVAEASAAAAATPDPEEDPPGSRARSQGLCGCPNGGSSVPPRANSERLSLPRRIAPADRRRAITVASSDAT